MRKQHTAPISAYSISTKSLQTVNPAQSRLRSKKGDILGITGTATVAGEEPNLVYSFEGFPEIVSQKEVKTPSEFTIVVTKGNHYTLPVYEQSGYIFVGYFSRSDGMGIQLTDEKGNSLSVWNGSNDATVYPYYVKRP